MKVRQTFRKAFSDKEIEDVGLHPVTLCHKGRNVHNLVAWSWSYYAISCHRISYKTRGGVIVIQSMSNYLKNLMRVKRI